MAFVDADTNGTQEYFKPANHAGAVAILIEVKRDAPGSLNNFGETKDAVYADLTVFDSPTVIESGKPTATYRNQRIENSALQNHLRDNVGVGNEAVHALKKFSPAKGGNPYWRWVSVDDSIKSAVVKYYQDREAALKAALEDPEVPDYLKG